MWKLEHKIPDIRDIADSINLMGDPDDYGETAFDGGWGLMRKTFHIEETVFLCLSMATLGRLGRSAA